MNKDDHLPRTSRVSENIIDYCKQHGYERKLWKFLRIDSPENTDQTTTSEEDSIGIEKLFQQAKAWCDSSSTKLPDIDLGIYLEHDSNEQYPVINIPIRAEYNINTTSSASVENLRTPTKYKQSTVNKETQTPESIGKTHKRLEWDSLGDIGYTKSKSTSNISVLEQSMLRELFPSNIERTNETASMQSSNQSKQSSNQNKQSRRNVEKLDLKKHRTNDCLPSTSGSSKNTPQKYKTPPSPIACSSFRDSIKNSSKSTSYRRDVIHTRNQSTSMSLHKYHERSAQTTMNRLPFQVSQEIQVNMSRTSSNIGSTATPSSFDYYSSNSSPTTTDTSIKDSQKHSGHSYIRGITEMLERRKVPAQQNRTPTSYTEDEKKQRQHDVATLTETLQRALHEENENKENSVHSSVRSSSLLHSPQLQLGIQLLCSLIDAKTLNGHRKKQLVREIAKRISCMGIDSLTTSGASQDGRSNDQSSAPSGSGGSKSVKINEHQTTQNDQAKEYNNKSGQRKKESKRCHVTEKIVVVEKKNTKKCAPAKCDKCVQCQPPTTEPTTTTTATSTSSSSSKEIITQKVAATQVTDNYCSNTDSDQVTMREWLNPLTQSEIEYEEKKRQKQALIPKPTNIGGECEAQLNWIESEIQRLESLRQLLTQTKTTAEKTEQECDRITYDTVCSEQSSNERPIHEIEVIVEESHEDVLNLDDNSKCVRDRKRETQTVYDKPNDMAVPDFVGNTRGKPRFRTVHETIVTNEEQLLNREIPPLKSKQSACEPIEAAQRCKLDTPQSSNDTESVGSFVQQRKRVFLEQYKQKRRVHREQLLRQEQIRHDCMQQLPSDYIHHRHKSSSCHVQKSSKMVGSTRPPHDSAGQSNVLYTSTARREQHSYSHSSSSMFCLSSDISIPMGSHHTRSTPTTTHQYDDVAAAGICYPIMYSSAVPICDDAAAQTTDSVMHTRPIFRSNQFANSGNCWPQRYRPPPQTATACIQVKPKPIAYIIQFNKNKNKNSSSSSSSSSCPPLKCATATGPTEQPPRPSRPLYEEQCSGQQTEGANDDNYTTLTLRQHLERSRPKVLRQMMNRKAILNRLQAMRRVREREMRDIAENTSISSLEKRLRRLPPPPTKQLRIFPTHQMKAITKKHVAQLPEVLQRKQNEREEQRRRGNRVLRDIFNSRLQMRVRSGKISLNHSKTVI